VVFVVRRRRLAEPGPRHLESAVSELLDASRRFGSTIDVPEIHRILVAEALALTTATEAAVVMLDDAARPAVVHESTDGVLDGARLDRGIVRRVLDTGAAVRTIAEDPAFGTGPHSVLAVPLVRNGVIAGTVVALAPGDEPFGAADLDLLGQLAPMAAAALVSAGRHDDVAELSLTDGLTELGNRRRLDRDLVAALAVGVGTVGFVMVDIDHFKQYNDTHGHVAGDEALQLVGHILRDNVREIDVVYRYGGEEFCVLLPEATARDAAEVSERLRRAIEMHEFAGAESQPGGRLTISVGTTIANRTDPTEVKERADHALYEAKHRGRNQVVVDGLDALEGT
jgi:diguanylate cyclase (GGDEF)-like protein